MERKDILRLAELALAMPIPKGNIQDNFSEFAQHAEMQRLAKQAQKIKYYGSFTVTIEADSEEQRETLMDRLAEALDDLDINGLEVDGFNETEKQWEG